MSLYLDNERFALIKTGYADNPALERAFEAILGSAQEDAELRAYCNELKELFDEVIGYPSTSPVLESELDRVDEFEARLAKVL